jgi:GNAT superfamily N-acetyltransferase
MSIDYAWRGEFTNAEVNALHAEGFGHEILDNAGSDFRGQVEAHSLGWVCARTTAGMLVGWVNVIWDGAAHAFVLDTVTSPAHQRQGIGTALVALAVQQARAAGCQWLHVDFEPHLMAFYLDSCGFRPTKAGLIRL